MHSFIIGPTNNNYTDEVSVPPICHFTDFLVLYLTTNVLYAYSKSVYNFSELTTYFVNDGLELVTSLVSVAKVVTR